MAAKKKTIIKWSAADLGLTGDGIGANSGTRTVKVSPPPPRSKGEMITGGDAGRDRGQSVQEASRESGDLKIEPRRRGAFLFGVSTMRIRKLTDCPRVHRRRQQPAPGAAASRTRDYAFDGRYSLAHATVQPGETTVPPSPLPPTKCTTSSAGQGMMHVSGKSAEVTAGDVIEIPPERDPVDQQHRRETSFSSVSSTRPGGPRTKKILE